MYTGQMPVSVKMTRVYSHTLAFIFASWSFVAGGRIVMADPISCGVFSLNNRPLSTNNLELSCKQGPVFYDLVMFNVCAARDTQLLSSNGTSIWGDESCQISIITDVYPKTDYVCEIMRSIEERCPAQRNKDLMGDNAEAVVLYESEFAILPGLAPGDYTLAWTWFNKVEHQRVYMDCAPLRITGEDFFTILPHLSFANNRSDFRSHEPKRVYRICLPF